MSPAKARSKGSWTRQKSGPPGGTCCSLILLFSYFLGPDGYPPLLIFSRVSDAGQILSYFLGMPAAKCRVLQMLFPLPIAPSHSHQPCTQHFPQIFPGFSAPFSGSFNLVPCTCSNLPYWETSQLTLQLLVRIGLVTFASK